MRGIRLALFFRRALARIAGLQRGDDHRHLLHAFLMMRLDQHPPHAWIHRQPRQLLADLCQLPVRIERADLAQRSVSLGHRFRVWRIEEWELGNLRQPQRFHPQDHTRQRATADLRLREIRPIQQILLCVEPQAHAVPHPPASPLPLPRARLAHRLHLQALHALRRIPPTHPRQPAVQHASDARDRQARFRHVCRQHNAP